jgi:hypothetical protein
MMARQKITFGRAVRRVLALILALLPLGLGYRAILRDPRRRGWHDRMTGTEVIYDGVARAAPHAGGTARRRPLPGTAPAVPARNARRVKSARLLRTTRGCAWSARARPSVLP